MWSGYTRREFLKHSLIGGVALGAGFGHLHIAHGQTNLRFSTWHVPAGRDVQTVWIPMLEELKRKSKDRIQYAMFAGGALGKGTGAL